MLCRPDKFLLFSPGNAFGRIAKTRPGPVANLNENQSAGVFHDQIQFASAPGVISGDQGQALLAQETPGSLFSPVTLRVPDRCYPGRVWHAFFSRCIRG